MANLKNNLITSRLTLNAKEGFTLIELMVAIAIVAVLATIGFTLFQNTQGQARDAKRKQDIDSISTVLEQKFDAAQGIYNAIAGTDFTTQTVPTDPLTPTYNYTIIQSGSAVTIVAGLPGAVGNTTYTVCARLENLTGNSSDTAGASQSNGSYYCRRNQQQ